MTLRDRLTDQDRRRDELTPLVERRQVERRIPEWRRRAMEQHDRLGFVAVVDLTERGAA